MRGRSTLQSAFKSQRWIILDGHEFAADGNGVAFVLHHVRASVGETRMGPETADMQGQIPRFFAS